MSAVTNPEADRVRELVDDSSGWRRWGPYLSDRSWGTVREDYSADGDAWRFLSYDAARAKAYRWGEDGIAGICDRFQLLCLAPAFWNGHDGHLKERFFGVTPRQGNHGEDAKEQWFHLDNVPSHAFMSLLYRYPQRPFPYEQLLAECGRRRLDEPEYELADTGIFAEGRYFDIVIEYAKATPEEIALRITATNRGPEAAPLHVLPTLWFRNTWGWGRMRLPRPVIRPAVGPTGTVCLEADVAGQVAESSIPPGYRLGRRWLVAEAGATPLFTDNETNAPVTFGPGHRSVSPHTKDAFHRRLCAGDLSACNPALTGT